MKENKISQTDFDGREISTLKEKVRLYQLKFMSNIWNIFFQLYHSELVEVAYTEELSNRIDEITNLSNEVVTLKSTIDELLLNSNQAKLGRQDSSLEFEALSDKFPANGENYNGASEAIQQDLMTELKSFEDKLKEKDKEIHLIDSNLKDKEQTIEKLHQILNFNSQFLVEIQTMNKMIEKKTKGSKAPSRDEFLDQQQFKESLEPETFHELSQVQAIQRLKENIEKILKECMGNESQVLTEKKSQLQLQEERIKQAFLENEAAEKETEKKLGNSWGDDSPASTIEKTQQQESEKTKLIEIGVESLSQQIVDSLVSTLSSEDNQINVLLPQTNKAFTHHNGENTTEEIRQKNMEIKKLQDGLKFQKQQDKYHIEELQSSVQQERSQTLKMMEKLNEEKQGKTELQEEIYILRDELCDLQTQLVRHKDEIEELTSLYEAEKLQTLVLEEALAGEKDNFNKLTKSLNEERKRSNETSSRDSDTIMELRTALEIEKEKEARLGVESPYPGGMKSHRGSKQSLLGSRQSLSHGQEKIQEDLVQV